MLKNELQGIISGTRSVTNGTAIQAITNFIKKSKAAGTNAKKDKLVKEQEATAILTYADINDFFVANPSYELIGIVQRENQLLAAVKQPFIQSTSSTDIARVKELMVSNGFVNNRNNDYINTKLGIIAEDLHDENVLNNQGVLFFIDTVFFLMPAFYH